MRNLQGISEHLVIELDDAQLVSLLPSKDPGPPLPLGIYQHGVPGSPSHQDTVLDAQVVCRQALHHMPHVRMTPLHVMKLRRGQDQGKVYSGFQICRISGPGGSNAQNFRGSRLQVTFLVFILWVLGVRGPPCLGYDGLDFQAAVLGYRAIRLSWE